ncbi:MAG: D-alanyl-D-alanine carboxypeptidase family protein [bacterium]
MRRHKAWGVLLLLIGAVPLACAPKPILRTQPPAPKAVVLAAPSVSPTPAPAPAEPPTMTKAQLLGFRDPPDMATDPESGKRAQAAVIAAYEKLRVKALENGWHLILVSGYRSYWHQVRLWNERYHKVSPDDKMTTDQRVRAIMDYVDLPGLSRHHWGTELDISEESLRGQLLHRSPDLPQRVKDFYAWMADNAPLFGFCRTYKGTGGFIQDEPWHWSYQPYSRVYTAQFESIHDFRIIEQKSVLGSDYVLKHFPEIYQGLENSVDPACCR